MIIYEVEEYKVKVSDCLDKKNYASKTFLRFPIREQAAVNQKGKELGCLKLGSSLTVKLNKKSLLNHA